MFPKKINSINELDNLLGNEFILFCGSAISAGMTNRQGSFSQFLPMINDATKNFYWYLHMCLKNSTYFGKVLSQYALSLAIGKYSYGRIIKKFEEFLWRLENILKVDRVSELIKALYKCDSGQYTHNH